MTAPVWGSTRPRNIGVLSGDDPKPSAPSAGMISDGGPHDTEQNPPRKPSLGFWLDGPEADVAPDIDKLWNAQNPSMKNRYARWELNERRIDGDTYSKLVHDIDQDSYRIYTPENAELAPPSLNKTRDLSNKTVANLLVDPPKFEAEPPSDTDEDIAAAEFSTRALENECGETGLDLVGALEEAEDLACIYGSAFIRFYVDPSGGGQKAKEIWASKAATTVEDALFVTVPAQPAGDGPDGQPAAGVPESKQPQPGPYFIRYVKPDGSLTDDPSEADLEWLPKIKREVLTGKNVRFLPETCTGIEDADGVLIAAYTNLGDLKLRFPDTIGALPAEALQKLVSYRPPDTKKLIPKWAGSGQGTKRPGQEGPPDDAQVLTITGYRHAKPDYPKGAYVCMAGGKFILERMGWDAQMTSVRNDPAVIGSIGPDGQAPDKKKVPLPMDIPVSQIRQFRDPKGHDPYGRGMVDLVGDGDPLRAFVVGSLVEYLHRVNNPHIFVPVGGVHENYIGLPRGTPIPFNPAAGGKPEYEQIASFPPEFMELFREIGDMQDSTSGLAEAAQGLSDPNAQSGISKQIVVEQALVALGKPKRNLDKAGIRSCRIILQLMRQTYTTPQKIRVSGEDGAFKEQEWTEADLGTTLDARIMPGTSTMLPASAKQDLIMRYATPVNPNEPPIISMAEAKRLVRTGVRSLVGMQDSKPLLRIKGQIKQWNDGPPKDWKPVTAPVDPATGQPVPPLPDPANPFADQRPTDDDQENAKQRYDELSDLISSGAFRKWGDQWGNFALREWQRAKTSAGIMTIPEQQQAQAQQAAAQQQAEARKQSAAAGEKAADREATASESDAGRAHATEIEAMKQQGAEQRAAAAANANGMGQ